MFPLKKRKVYKKPSSKISILNSIIPNQPVFFLNPTKLNLISIYFLLSTRNIMRKTSLIPNALKATII